MLLPQTDREVLVAIDSKLSNLVDDFREMKDTISAKASHESVSGLEMRIRIVERRQRTVEKKVYMASGAAAVLALALKLLPLIQQVGK